MRSEAPKATSSIQKIFGAAGVILAIASIAAAVAAPPQVADWLLRCGTLVMLATSWNLMANAGLISLGHSAFWGAGSFAAVLSLNALHLPLFIALPLSALSGSVLGAFLARTTGRLLGIYFAIATLALAEGLRVLALMLPGITGGAAGMFVIASIRPLPRTMVMIAVLGAIGCVLVAYLMSRSRFHFALQGMRNDETSVQMIGVDPRKFRLGTTILSGAMASSAGAISACYTGYLDPEVAFNLDHTIMAQIAPILGGLYTIAGPVIGAFAIVILSEGTRIGLGSVPGLSLVMFGLLLALSIRFMPGGIMGQLMTWHAAVWHRRSLPFKTSEATISGSQRSAHAYPAPEPNETAAHLLTVERISAGYGDSVVLEDVSFHVGGGEVVCLLGANGAGKTTTMSVLTGLLPAASGRIFFNGSNLSLCSSDERVAAGLALSPEGRQVFPSMSVEENLALGSYHRGAREHRSERLDQVFSLFPKLKERRDQPAGLMSGGEQQMLAIGRALMAGPKLLLLDEPSLGLAPKIVQTTFESIARIAQSGVSVLIVEQNTQAALSISHRGYVMADGRISAQGSAAELSQSTAIRDFFLGRRIDP